MKYLHDFEFSFIPDLVMDYVSGKLPVEVLSDKVRMHIHQVFFKCRDEFVPILDRTEIHTETTEDGTLILYNFPTPERITDARYGAVLVRTDGTPEYYTLELTSTGRYAFCKVDPDRHILIDFVLSDITIDGFSDLVRKVSETGISDDEEKGL